MLTLLMKICRYNFGEFEVEEFKKFLLMGLIFSLIIGIYWTLKPLKDSIFILLINKESIPYAKSLTVIALIPIMIFFTKLLEQNSLEKIFSILSLYYGVMIFVFSAFMIILDKIVMSPSMIVSVATEMIGYLWYILVDSFGSLFTALFWAFATDTTDTSSAKKGFSLIVAIGQIGGIIFPYSIGGLPHRFGFTNDSAAMIILGILTLCIIPAIKYFIAKTPKELLASFQTNQGNLLLTKPEPDFSSGLRLIISKKYLFSIFVINFIYEVIITILDFNFKLAAATTYSGVELSQYLSIYGSTLNLVSFITLLLGISNITRSYGIGIALLMMPIIFTITLLVFIMHNNSLPILFALMVVSRSLNYSLNNPAIKQLFIPTTTIVRYQSQAWIESFGSRLSKEAGSLFNMILKPLQYTFGDILGRIYYLKIVTMLGVPLMCLWLSITVYVNKTYKKALKKNQYVC